MLGWEITVTRPQIPVLGPNDRRLDLDRPDATGLLSVPDDLSGDRLASWSASFGGMDWVDAAIGDSADGRELRGGGYPNIYAMPAEILLDTIDLQYVRTTVLDRTPPDLSAIAAVPSGEWLLVEAWDQS
ncbi:hypothetical protein [Prescottella subtropica]|uniref:hypothetical protein n=1 Tax=Prescottella subtropica TaxID=2545757 RepID=UPI0010F938AC|nr:hypothetical protein [Prescottella subtropica]